MRITIRHSIISVTIATLALTGCFSKIDRGLDEETVEGDITPRLPAVEKPANNRRETSPYFSSAAFTFSRIAAGSSVAHT